MVTFSDGVDKFYELMQVGNVYLVSKGTLKAAAKQYTHFKAEYEITLDRNSVVEHLPNDPMPIIQPACEARIGRCAGWHCLVSL